MGSELQEGWQSEQDRHGKGLCTKMAHKGRALALQAGGTCLRGGLQTGTVCSGDPHTPAEGG